MQVWQNLLEKNRLGLEGGCTRPHPKKGIQVQMRQGQLYLTKKTPQCVRGTRCRLVVLGLEVGPLEHRGRHIRSPSGAARYIP